MQRKNIAGVSSAILMVLAITQTAMSAETVRVEMLDKGPDGHARVFMPDVVFIDPGDTVHFVATDFGHDVASVQDLRPEGAKSFSGYKNAPLKVTFTQPGVHVYECESHRKKGMVGVVVVGDASVNLDEVEATIKNSSKVSEKGEKRLNRIFEKVRDHANGE